MSNLKKFLLSFGLIFCLFSFVPGVFAYEKSVKDLATKFNITAEKMDTILTEGKRKFVPIVSSDKDFYIGLLSNKKNLEYMKYYRNGHIMSKASSENIFKGKLSRMWNFAKPKTLAFIVKEDGKSVGFISIGPVDSPSSDPEMGMIVEKKFSGKGLGNFIVKKLVSVMQELKNLRIYKYKSLISTIKPDNAPSRKAVLKAGFTTSEKIVKTSFGYEKIYKYQFS